MCLLHIQLTPVQPIPAPSTRCSWKFRLFPSFLHVRKPEAWRTRARSCLHAAKSEKLPGCVLCKLNRTCAESDASFAFEANHRVPAHWPDPGASWRRCDPAYCRAFGSDSKVGASPAPRPPPPPPAGAPHLPGGKPSNCRLRHHLLPLRASFSADTNVSIATTEDGRRMYSEHVRTGLELSVKKVVSMRGDAALSVKRGEERLQMPDRDTGI